MSYCCGEKPRGFKTATGAIHYLALIVATIACVFALVSSARAASSFYWYGESDSNCWQTGQPGSPHSECDSVSAGFLPTPGGHTGGLEHMSEGGVATDLTLSPSGDYCSYYRLGDQLTSQDSTNEGTLSGLAMPTPYSSYQEGDKTSGAWNACQADGSYWGQAVRGPSGKGCAETCGMHHYVSFNSQKGTDRPWDTRFGSPSLVLSAEAGVKTFTYAGNKYKGWGYVCPELEDTTFHGVIEYCFQEWRAANNAVLEPEWKNERATECGGAGYAQVQTYFYPGTSFSTEIAGSANTFEVGSTGSGHYEAKITEADLAAAANAINHHCLGWGLSENASNYALVGVEQGIEGENGVTALGGWGANLQLRTEYTSAPHVTTGTASEVGEEQATFNGSLNPEGSDTHYYFQYGPTTAYGSDAPVPPGNDAGAGTGAGPVSATTTQLEQDITYHYRLVASNSYGTSYGSDQTLTTTGHQGLAVAVQGPNNTLDYYENYDNEPWNKTVIGGANSTYGTPSLVRFTDRFGKGVQIVVQGTNHTLDYYAKYDGGSWYQAVVGGSEGATYGTPSMVRFNDKYGTGVELFVEGANHTLDFYANYDGEPSWSKAVVGSEGSTYGAPSIARFDDRYGTGVELFVEGVNHTLDFYAGYDGEPWSKAVVGAESSTYGAPSIARFNDRYGTGVELFVEGVNHTLDFYANYDGEPSWSKAVVGSEGSTYGAPSVARFSDAWGTGIELFVEGVNHTLDFYAGYDNEPWSKSVVGGENSTYGTPSMARLHAPRGTFEL